jgi:hypothetical protein
MDDKSLGILVLLFFILGILCGLGIEQSSNKTNYKTVEQKQLLSECEKALPRNQKCIIVLSTRIENIE